MPKKIHQIKLKILSKLINFLESENKIKNFMTHKENLYIILINRVLHGMKFDK